jgi:protein-S-isoprenylcysteine O-methyltransferase Ste14
MNEFKKWAEHEYSKKQRIIAVIFGGTIFWIVIPFFIVVVSSYVDQRLHLPKFYDGLLNPVVGLPFMIVGWLFANWAVKVQFSLGRGTPIPLMPTQRLIIKEPYTYCRNPMTLGTAIFYSGVAIWLGSISAVGLGLVYPVGILIYIKLIEERELEERFGSEYLGYKMRTPFLIPRFRKKARKKDKGSKATLERGLIDRISLFCKQKNKGGENGGKIL